MASRFLRCTLCVIPPLRWEGPTQSSEPFKGDQEVRDGTVGEVGWKQERDLPGALREPTGLWGEGLRAVPGSTQQESGDLSPATNHKQLNSVQSHVSSEEDPACQVRPQPGQHLHFSLVRP